MWYNMPIDIQLQGLYLEVYCDRFDINEEKLYKVL